MKKVLNNQIDYQTGSSTYIQPQMEVGKVDDEYEKEANDVADKIMRMPESDQMLKMRTDSESVQMMKMDEDYPAKIQTMSEGNKGGMTAPQNVEQGINNSKGSGQSLPATTQADLGTKMNADLSNVKIHTDSNSVQMNKERGAWPNPFTDGYVKFQDVPAEIRDLIRVIPEDAKSTGDVFRPLNDKWYSTDGLWIKGEKKWLKIPNHAEVIVTYNEKEKMLRFQSSVHWVTSWFKDGVRWVPDSGATTHITDYPF